MAITTDASLFAIILAGGASSRLHATSPEPTVDKPLLLLDGKPVLHHVIDAASRFVAPERIVVVGPKSLPSGDITTICEDPPQSGPYMAVHTGVEYFADRFGPAGDGEGVLLLGADMPRIALGLEQLLGHRGSKNIVIAQAGSRLQPLLSYVPRQVAEQLFSTPVVNAGLMRALRSRPHDVVDVDEAAVVDLDTYQDALDSGVTF